MSLVSRVRSRATPLSYSYLGETWVTGYAHTTFYRPNTWTSETCVDATHPGPPFKSGGGLELTKAGTDIVPSGLFDEDRSIYHYRGRFIPISYHDTMEISYPTWSIDTDEEGTKGWSRFRPGHPQASIGQFLVELHRIPTLPLRELLRLRSGLFGWRRLFRQHGLTGRNAGKEFLNIEYGWRPFLGDLRRYVHAMDNLAKTLQWLKNHNGRKVRTGGTVLDETVTTPGTHTFGPSLYPTLVTSWYVDPLGRGWTDWTTEDSVHAWFSAEWKYFVKDVESPQWTAKAKAILFGLYPTPSLLWEVLPWTWLIDWAGNIGTILANMSPSAVGYPAAHHAFVMKHQVHHWSVTETNTFKTTHGPVTLSASRNFVRETKVRHAASPFGFGVDNGSLTDEQLLILLALGISRYW